MASYKKQWIYKWLLSENGKLRAVLEDHPAELINYN